MLTVDKICRAALAKYGEQAQIDMCIEECGELIVALQHYKRGLAAADHHDIITEIADVQIMCEQMQELFGDSATNTERHRKWNRLVERLGLNKEE